MKSVYVAFVITLALLLVAGLALFVAGVLPIERIGRVLAAQPQPEIAARSQATRPSLQPTFTSTPIAAIAAEEIVVATPEAIATPFPTEPLPLPTATPAALFQPPAQSVALTGLRHQWQTWNNCGPATLSMNLSYFGSTLGQDVIGAALRRSADDKNVSPEELLAYARAQGFSAQLRVNGSAELLKMLVTNGFPVLIETWLEEEPNDGLGHYRLITGYDEARQSWIAYDTYVARDLVAGAASADKATLEGSDSYAGIYLPYAKTDTLWKVFNRTWLLIHPPENAPLVEAILGNADSTAMWQAAEAQARSETAANPGDAYAWFNLGSSLWALGNSAEAVAAFDQARAIGLPWRMFWYQFAPFAAYLDQGRTSDVIALADSVLVNTTSIEEVHYWKGRAQATNGDTAGALTSYDAALALFPGYADALTARGEVAPTGG